MMIYTIGHSTRSIEDFVRILKAYGIETLVDIRHFPASRKFPWFGREALAKSLEAEGIKYVWLEDLGGFRKGGYEAYMKTDDYKKELEKVLEIASKSKAAFMCAEVLWFRCHRRYVSEDLVKMGHTVMHIYDSKRAQEHRLAEERMKLRIFCDVEEDGVGKPSA